MNIELSFMRGKHGGRHKTKPQYILCLVTHTAVEKKPMSLHSPQSAPQAA